MDSADCLQVPALPAVEIQDAYAPLRPRRILDDAQRRAQDVANAERDRAGVKRRVHLVEQVRDHAVGSGGVDLLWNTLAGLGRRQRDAAAGTGQAEPQRATRLREKDEPSLGSRDL